MRYQQKIYDEKLMFENIKFQKINLEKRIVMRIIPMSFKKN